MSSDRRLLVIVLRALGLLDLLALVAVAMPHAWMSAAHGWVGLGPLPQQPIIAYLTRSASALYALHGAMVLFVSFDVGRYLPLIRFLAIAALVHGAVMLGIDVAAGMPALWTLIEPPCFAASGAIVLLVMRFEGATCAA